MIFNDTYRFSLRMLPCVAMFGMLASILPTAVAEEVVGQSEYERDVLPVLKKFCGECHARETREERWAFDGYEEYAELMADKARWGKVEQLVSNQIMPPHGAALPSLEQRKILLNWIDNAVFFVDPARPDPGRLTLRRLNREEYNHSVRDVLGVESRPADSFPLDDAGYGFDNIADVLTVSSLHFEKYLGAAREIAEEVVRLKSPPRVGVELLAAKLTTFSGHPELQENAVWLGSTADEVGTTIVIPALSTYRVLTRAAVVQHGNQLATIAVLCDGKPMATLAPQAQWQGKPGAMATAFALVSIPEGEHRIALRVQTPADATNLPASVGAIQFLSITGPFTPAPPETSSFLKQAVAATAGDSQRSLAEPILRLSGEDLDAGTGRSSLDTGRAWFSSNGYRHAPILIKESGAYRVRFKVGAQQVGDEGVKFEVRLRDQTLGPFTVTAGSQKEQWVETTCELTEGEHDWQVWFVNELKDPDSGVERYFWLHEFSIEGPLERTYGLSRDEVIDLLEQTGRRLFRRTLTENEVAKLRMLVDAALRGDQATSAALETGLAALLVSPKFLYHPQPRPATRLADGTRQIDELTLASRLSYFLWSSVPDEELLQLAERNQLRSQLAQQVRRMIADPKIARLTANFAGQWLQLRDLEQAAPATEVFPEFDSQLAADMRRESELLFEHILGENRPVLEFLSADYTFINRRLAEHYHLPLPAEEGFHRVSLAGSPRRGIMTHGSVLTLTSHPTRTSPVKRGKWLLEQMLGTEPPPAPPDITPLSESPENENLSLRVRFEQHRSNDQCAACHALLDPMGFALENYDAIGRWRTMDAGQPVDATGQLISGECFEDWSQLRDILIERHQDEFLQCLTEHLLTYSLGRGVTYQDKLTVREIVASTKSGRRGFQDLILAVCESIPFQRMRDESQQQTK